MRIFKIIVIVIAGVVPNSVVLACEVCDKQQPEILRGITHGVGPAGGWDYAVVWLMIFIAIVSLFYSVKWILRPGEKESKHIKRSILNWNNHE